MYEIHLENLLVGVNDRSGRPADSGERDAFGVGSQFDGPFRWNCVSWIENCAAWDASEHRQIFKSHLTRTILSDADTAVASYHIYVALWYGPHTQLKRNNHYKLNIFSTTQLFCLNFKPGFR